MNLVSLTACALLLFPVQRKRSDENLTSGRPIPPEQACYDVTQYDIFLRVDPEERAIAGSVAVQARLLGASREVVFDLDDRLKVEKVEDWAGPHCSPAEGGTPLDFKHAKGEIRVRAAPDWKVGEVFKVRVTYGGKPREAPNAPWDGGFVWSRTPSGAHWIATANQMQGADLWWPCKDQPNDEADTVFLQVSVPSGLVVASNGRPAAMEPDFDAAAHEERRGWNNHQWVVTTPINSYGIALNIAPYETITRDYTSVAGDTFPVTYWVLPENVAKGKVLFEDILRQMAQLEQLFGPYPFRGDKYGVAETPHLGMEHQTIIAYGNAYRNDLWGEDRGYDELHLHEFAHEWWANLVTAENWNDFWIHESFASYTQALYAERVGGPKAYFTEMSEQLGHLHRAAIAPREKRSTADMYFGDREGSPGIDIYHKGSWVLHTLRWLMTDEEFFPALRRMAYPDPTLEKTTDGSACRFATTEEIRAIAEQSSGLDLAWFFEVYLRQPRLPVLETEVVQGELRLAWKSPTKHAFPMPVEVQVGDEFVRVECPGGKGRLELRGRSQWTVDPRERVLREGNGQR